jgi:hypothetical protein
VRETPTTAANKRAKEFDHSVIGSRVVQEMGYVLKLGSGMSLCELVLFQNKLEKYFRITHLFIPYFMLLMA